MKTNYFVNPEDFSLELGGWQCLLFSTILSRKALIHKVHRKSKVLLPAHVAIPSDKTPGLPSVRNKVYVFAFLTALVADDQKQIEQAISAGQNVCFLHYLPEDKFRFINRSSLGEISLKCDTSEKISVTLGGQNLQREYQTINLSLLPRERLVVPVEFSSLSYVRVENRPDGLMGIHTPLCGEPYLIPTSQWTNIWVYGMKIIFVGYLPGEVFVRKAQRLAPGKLLLSGRKTQLENLVIPVHQLRPLQKLFDKTAEWATES